MANELTIEFANSAADWKAWLRYRLSNVWWGAAKQVLVVALSLGLTIFLVLVVLGERDWRDPVIGVFGIVVFGAFLAVIVYRLISMLFWIWRFDRKAKLVSPSTVWRLTASEEGLRLKTSDKEELCAWSKVGSVEWTENAIYITGAAELTDVVIVPRRSFSDPESYRRFEETLNAFLRMSREAVTPGVTSA